MAIFSLIELNNLEGANRIDAEYYQPFYIDVKNKLLKKKTTTIAEETSRFKKGIFDIKAECYSDTGVPFVRISNLKNMIIDENDLIYIPIEEDKKNKMTHLKKGDIILSKTAYPAASYVTLDECNCSQDTIAVKLKERSQIDSSYLTVFLNSKYGMLQMQRCFTGNIQMHLNLIESKEILIPVFDQSFHNQIKKIFEDALQNLLSSRMLFKQAENILLDEIKYNKLVLQKKTTYTRFFSEILKERRIDAQYYQPHLDQIINLIKEYGSKKLVNVIRVKDKNFVPKGDKQYKYIELANISKDGFINDYMLEYGDSLPTRARRIIRTNDVIISSVEGSLSSCALITEEYDNVLCSTGFYVLESDEINPETLVVLFKSKPIQELLKKGCSGTILMAINKNELEKIDIPIIENNVQNEIAKKIKTSYEERSKAKSLLEEAKKKVEEYIDNPSMAAR